MAFIVGEKGNATILASTGEVTIDAGIQLLHL